MWNVNKYRDPPKGSEREKSHISSYIATTSTGIDSSSRKKIHLNFSTSSQNTLICLTVLSLSLVCAIFHSVFYGHYVSTPHFAHIFFFVHSPPRLYSFLILFTVPNVSFPCLTAFVLLWDFVCVWLSDRRQIFRILCACHSMIMTIWEFFVWLWYFCLLSF